MLSEHHHDIHILLSEADEALGGIYPSRIKLLALVRWQLMRRLRTYQLFKHTELFDPVICANDLEQSGSARAMKARCIAIGETYNKHVEKCCAAGIESDWNAYKTETASLILTSRSHLLRERSEAGVLISESGPRSLAVKGVGS